MHPPLRSRSSESNRVIKSLDGRKTPLAAFHLRCFHFRIGQRHRFVGNEQPALRHVPLGLRDALRQRRYGAEGDYVEGFARVPMLRACMNGAEVFDVQRRDRAG